MDHFEYVDQTLFAEGISCESLANQYGTPCFVYSSATLRHHFKVFENAFNGHHHLICYAVKANSNLSVLKQLAMLGSGFDIVSSGELNRVITAGGSPSKTVFSGVGKQDFEMRYALQENIFCFNIESNDELIRLNKIAQSLDKKAPIAIRVNPDVDSKSHPFISTGLKSNKFGIPIEDALEIYTQAKSLSHIHIKGVACHIGSQILELGPFIEVSKKMNAFFKKLKSLDIKLNHIDLGGGLGVSYAGESPPSPKEWVETMLSHMEDCPQIIIEPGRALAANAGVLLTKVITIKETKEKNFAIVDCAMNDLIRPALYNAYQDIIPTHLSHDKNYCYDIVGPICETGDFLGKERTLAKLHPGQILCIRGAGAYGFVMSSNYNTRPRAAEIIVMGNKSFVVRDRETIEDLYHLETRGLEEFKANLLPTNSLEQEAADKQQKSI